MKQRPLIRNDQWALPFTFNSLSSMTSTLIQTPSLKLLWNSGNLPCPQFPDAVT
ncbi:hypothetical protein HOLDEFILI_00314 [Holdemania filiformis DSM 12042]|uniref:Uncharacterized protein n=1 Tax=Holdemania filiformis DSM 12042 TaxID=545696 RepID=B9Y3D9_9FIRM|nr:hypothetical protein HOLDEFILI_00314 [Holdemania filiformis DSM 12042]